MIIVTQGDLCLHQRSLIDKVTNTFKRTDLSVTDNHFETIWVEIINTKGKKIFYRCAYLHPSFNPVRFKENFESILSQLSR